MLEQSIGLKFGPSSEILNEPCKIGQIGVLNNPLPLRMEEEGHGAGLALNRKQDDRLDVRWS